MDVRTPVLAPAAIEIVGVLIVTEEHRVHWTKILSADRRRGRLPQGPWGSAGLYPVTREPSAAGTYPREF